MRLNATEQQKKSPIILKFHNCLCYRYSRWFSINPHRVGDLKHNPKASPLHDISSAFGPHTQIPLGTNTSMHCIEPDLRPRAPWSIAGLVAPPPEPLEQRRGTELDKRALEGALGSTLYSIL